MSTTETATPPPATPTTRVEKTVRKSLPVPLTHDEVQAKTTQMVGDMTELERLETEFAALKKERSAEIKELKGSINKARKIVATQTEMRLLDDALQIIDLESRRFWYEYRGHRFEERTAHDYEIREATPSPLFPDHKENDPDSFAAAEAAHLENEPGVAVEPYEAPEERPSNVSDIEAVRRSETQRTLKKDHLANG